MAHTLLPRLSGLPNCLPAYRTRSLLWQRCPDLRLRKSILPHDRISYHMTATAPSCQRGRGISEGADFSELPDGTHQLLLYAHVACASSLAALLTLLFKVKISAAICRHSGYGYLHSIDRPTSCFAACLACENLSPSNFCACLNGITCHINR